jgi:Fusaric acid resistance protein family
MGATVNEFPVASREGWFDWLRRELAPVRGRREMTVRLVLGVVLVTIISMSLQVPEAALSAYMVFFVTKQNRVLTALTGVLLIVGVTVAIAATLLLLPWTLDFPALRVITMASLVFTGMFLSRVFVIGPLGFAIGFVMAVAQSFVDGARSPEIAVRALLWLWVIIVYPIALTVVLNQVVLPTPPASAPGPKPAASAKVKKRIFVADAFTNPAYAHFALNVTLASMTCYFIYTGVDWSGIHTAFITCCIIALESTGATLQKGWLRLCGCLTGGLLGFISILFVVPHMETIASLVLLTAAVSTIAGWIAAGSQSIAYAGLQMAFAFYLAIFQGFAPGTKLDVIRDRIAGIVLGIVVMTVVFCYLWPEEKSPSPIVSH